MRRNQSWLAACVAVCALAVVGSSPVFAQASASGSTSVSIDVPDVVILHYFSAVDVTIDGASMGSFLTGTASAGSTNDEGTGSGTASLSGTDFTLDLAIAPTLTGGGDPTAAVLILENAWAVRSISGAATTETELAVTITGASMTNGSSSIDLSSATVNDGTSNAATITFTPPGLAPALQGDVELTLDFSGAVAAGSHTGGEFTLTATNI